MEPEALKAVFLQSRNLAEWGALIVFLGLLGDFAVLFAFAKDKPKAETWLTALCTFFIAVGVFGEYRFGHRANDAADQLQRYSDEKIGLLNKEAAEAASKQNVLRPS